MDVLVVDWGSDKWKIGHASSLPQLLPCPPGAVVNGLLSDWQAFREGLVRCCEVLNCLPEEQILVITTPPQYPAGDLEMLEHNIFDVGIKLLRTVESPPLALCTDGCATGIAIDIGFEKTSVTTILNGTVLDYVTTAKLRGTHSVVAAIIAAFADEHGVELTVAEAQEILAAHGGVAHTPAQLSEHAEVCLAGRGPRRMWTRTAPDGTCQEYDVAGLALKACEELFACSATGVGLGSLVHDIVARVFASNFKHYAGIVSHVSLCGGGADIPGVASRLRYELRPWPKLRVFADAAAGKDGTGKTNTPSPSGRFKIWHGAAELTLAQDFYKDCVSALDRPNYKPKPLAIDRPGAAIYALPTAAQNGVRALGSPARGDVVPAAADALSPRGAVLADLRLRQDKMEQELAEMRKTREWVQLNAESQMIAFKADMEFAALQHGRAMSDALREKQKEQNATHAREKARHQEFTNLAVLDCMEQDRRLEVVRQEVERVRAEAEQTRIEQSRREARLLNALHMQHLADETELKRLGASILEHAETSRMQHIATETRLHQALQLLLEEQVHTQALQFKSQPPVEVVRQLVATLPPRTTTVPPQAQPQPQGPMHTQQKANDVTKAAVPPSVPTTSAPSLAAGGELAPVRDAAVGEHVKFSLPVAPPPPGHQGAVAAPGAQSPAAAPTRDPPAVGSPKAPPPTPRVPGAEAEAKAAAAVPESALAPPPAPAPIRITTPAASVTRNRMSPLRQRSVAVDRELTERLRASLAILTQRNTEVAVTGGLAPASAAIPCPWPASLTAIPPPPPPAPTPWSIVQSEVVIPTAPAPAYAPPAATAAAAVPAAAAAAAKEILAVPPPPESDDGATTVVSGGPSPARSADRAAATATFHPHEAVIAVRSDGGAEAAVVVGPYEGENANLVGKNLWWVRVNGGAKRLKPADTLRRVAGSA